MAEAQPRALPGDEQVAPHELLARLLELGARDPVGQRVHGRRLERVARDRAERQGGAFGGVEPVQARGEQRVQRRRQRRGLGARLLEEGDELLEEQRVAAGRPAIRRCSAGRGARRRSPRAAPCWRARTAARARSPRTAARSCRCRPGGPMPARLEQVGARDPGDEHRRVAQAGDDVEQQVEQGGLGQVRVVEHEHERPRARQGLDEPQERPAGVVARLPSARPTAAATCRACDGASPDVRRQLADRAPARRLLDDRPQRPVRDALAVGRAAAR